MDVKLPRDSYDLVGKKAALIKFSVSNTTLYGWIVSGLMTKQVKLGDKSVWPAHEVHVISAARTAGMTDAGIRALVDQFHEERKQLLATLS